MPKNPGPNMPRSMGPNMPRSFGPPGGFASPSQSPNRFQNQVTSHIDGLVSQMTDPRPGRVGLPDSGPQGHRRRRHIDQLPPDPNAPSDPNVGDQAFGTYAPGIDATQFTNENFKNKGLKGMRQLDSFGGLGGAMGGMMGSGGMGFGGGMGGGMMGGMQPDLMSFLSMVFPQLMSQMEDGPYQGR